MLHECHSKTIVKTTTRTASACNSDNYYETITTNDYDALAITTTTVTPPVMATATATTSSTTSSTMATTTAPTHDNNCTNKQQDAKKKWRNLRDQFSKELKKIPKGKSGDTQDQATIYTGRWRYFKSLLFLRDTILPRETARNLSVVLEDSTTATEADNNVANAEIVAKNTNATKTDNEVSNSEVKNSELTFVETCPSFRSLSVRRKRKDKHQDGNAVELRLLDIETKQLALLEASEDENSLFLRSLLPFMKKLDPIRQLRVR
ncbi:cell wall protein DAN4-like, partial [Rhagoletis pomonella]|uniref:cell wall protein DAN4-like n=1 Tax=Rhagoletis pomonella TaxID=28610 RepID=UPI0017814E05